MCREVDARLGKHLKVATIHAGKPPATALSILPRLFVPIARSLQPHERLSEYEKPERRDARRYSLLYVMRMTLLAYDRRKLLQGALRSATGGSIVISERASFRLDCAILLTTCKEVFASDSAW